MLSCELENIARALELISETLSEEQAAYLARACANLHALAERAEQLEALPLCVMAA